MPTFPQRRSGTLGVSDGVRERGPREERPGAARSRNRGTAARTGQHLPAMSRSMARRPGRCLVSTHDGKQLTNNRLAILFSPDHIAQGVGVAATGLSTSATLRSIKPVRLYCEKSLRRCDNCKFIPGHDYPLCCCSAATNARRAAAAPPSSVMNSRRFIFAVIR